MLLLCSCGTAYKKKEYYENINCLKSKQAVSAVLSDNNIQVRYPHGDHTDYLHASWGDPVSSGSEYGYNLSEVAFSRKSGKMSRDAREIPVLGSEKWQALLERVMESLAPERSGEGVSFVLHFRELVLYRDFNGSVYLKKLKDLPARIKITGLLKEDSIASAILRLLEKGSGPGSIAGRQFLYQTDNIYNGSVAFVFVDLEKRQTVFLYTPYHPEYRYDPGLRPVLCAASWVFRSGVLTLIKNPVTTFYRLFCRLKQSAAVILTGLETLQTIPEPDPSAIGMDLARWEKRLDDMFPDNRTFKGNIKFLIDGDKFFPRFIQCLRDAEKSIWIRTYIFDNDDYAVKIAEILKAKSKDVSVRVLADHMGCMGASTSLPSSPIPPGFEFPSDIFDYLEKRSKVRARATTNPWFTADHTKSIIIDSSRAFVGGMNIGREYRYEWHDLMMEVKGPVVGRLKKDFRRAWSHAGPLGDLAYALTGASTTNYSPSEELGDLYDVRPLYTKSGKTQIFDAQIEAIRNAKKYIYIQNPYFTENTILNELIAARGRGVDVRVILPSTSDYGFMDSSNIVTTNIMLENGIRVYQYPKISHIKAAIYDGWACLGSANFDALSLRINLETNLAFSDKETVERLKKELFEKDFSVSREVTDPVEVSFLDYIGEMISNQL